MKKWLNDFEHNRLYRRTVPWEQPLEIPAPALRAALIRSLQKFQIGESGEGRHLRKKAAATGDTIYQGAIDLFIKEEQEHARLMAGILRKLNAPLLLAHWSDGCFILLRRLFGLSHELLV